MKSISNLLFLLVCSFCCGLLPGCCPDTALPVKPEDDRFTTEVLASNLDEPMQFELMSDGRVVFAERKGKINVYDPSTKSVKVIAEIPVRHTFAGYTSSGTHESEDGIHGVLLDPQFESNHWIYVFYAPEVGGPKNQLSRFEWKGERVNLYSEKKLLEVPLDTSVCCHLGGGLVFDNDNNLLVATGENGQAEDGFSTLDERPGHETSDAQRTSANTNSFNGKILRIHPEDNGTYTIPSGNLFPPGTPKTRPEIYTMGNRNPWRITIDHKTGWLYWGEVGPNGNEDSKERGPRAYDEFNQARKAGNFGYPQFIADNKPYRRFDFATGKPGMFFDAKKPVNLSRNNTGVKELPPAQSAFIWYPYGKSDSFPLLGTGAMSAVGGPIYRQAKFPNASQPFPAYYDGKWFITDWVRGWIMAVTMDDEGNYKSMERFLPDQKHYGIIDIDFGPDGSLYLLEYGTGVFRASPEARLVKISYNPGNRAPVAKARISKSSGHRPLQVIMDGTSSVDPDGDRLAYNWEIRGPGNKFIKSDKNIQTLQLSTLGDYRGKLTVRDVKGLENSTEFDLTVGNEQPRIEINLDGANESFYYNGQKLSYNILVSDTQDGSTSNGTIAADKVTFEIEHLEILNKSALESLPWKKDEATSTMMANLLIDNSDCRSCHSIRDPSIGPSFQQVARKYVNDISAVSRLATKIIAGGNGAWGERMMPAHPGLTENEAGILARYILSSGKDAGRRSRVLQGNYTIPEKADTRRQEFILLRATYRDKGAPGANRLNTDERLFLRNPFVPVSRVDGYKNVEFNRQVDLDNSDITSSTAGSWIAMSQIDLNKVREIQFNATCNVDSAVRSGWQIAIKIDSVNGEIIARTSDIPSNLHKSVQSGERSKAVLEKRVGKHDLYFQFQHDASKPLSQVKLRDIEFILEK